MIILSVFSFIISFLLVSFNTIEAHEPWKVFYNSSKTICILATFSAQLVYNDSDTAHNKPPIAITPNDLSEVSVNSKSECTGKTAILILERAQKPLITITFQKNSDDLIVEEMDITVSEISPNHPINAETLKIFKVRTMYGYKCSKSEGIHYNESLILELSDVQWEVFRETSKRDSDKVKFINTPEKCSRDVELNESMPIIVGIVMAALVAVVLLILVFGRIRSRRIASKAGKH